MYLLLSGEGKSDLGCCDPPISLCEGNNFIPGPMAWFVDQLIDAMFEFSNIENDYCGFIPKTQLEIISKKLNKIKKSPRLPGKKTKQETSYYYKNARSLAKEALDIQNEKNDSVLAVLFRDSDGTNSTNTGDWQYKWDSIIKGFEDQNFDYGIPMLPKPKSEAWLLCATKNNYQHCDKLEDESGNDNSPNSLKKQLDESLPGRTSAVELAQMVKDKEIDVTLINMNSLDKFRDRLDEVLNIIQSL